MLLIRGGTIVEATGTSAADLLIEGERISRVGPDLDPAGAEVVDATGKLVIPGAVDVHTHLDLPVGAVRSADDFASGTVAAACGGTTCVIDFAGAGREPPAEALATWHARADGRAAVDYAFHLTVTEVPVDQGEADRLFAWFVEQGVTSVKLYLAYPERLMVDHDTLLRALVAADHAGVLVCVHAEDGLEAVRLTGRALEAGDVGPDALPRARPAGIEAAAVRDAAELAGKAEARLYVVHLSSAAALAEVHAARERGVDVLAETCPQYLFLTDERLRGPAEDAMHFCCTPPLRSDEDREALWDALASGEIQVVSTDHCPFTREARRRGVADRDEGWETFLEIPGGLPGVETRLALVYQGVREGRITAERWVEACCAAPARLFGLGERKGRLAEGYDADVVVFDPAATRRLRAWDLHMRTDHSPYADRTVVGWPAVTVARGVVVAWDGEPTDAPPAGRFLRRAPSARA